MGLYAAIDLGSNSFHLLIASIENKQIKPVERFSEKIQLGQHVTENGNLTPAAIKRGIKCLADFATALEKHPAERIRIVGTQALRQAGNGAEFMQQARNVLPAPIQVISGEEEARLIWLGLSNSLPASETPRLIIDIGGGSTEIAYGLNNRILFQQSMPLGCVAFRDHWFADGKLTRSRYSAALDAAHDCIAHGIADCPETLAVDYFGSSGTIKSIARIVERQGWCDPGIIDIDAIARLRDAVLDYGRTSRLKFSGLRKSRRSVLTSGLVILEAAMEELGMDFLVYSPAALREGLIFDMAQTKPN